MQRMTLLQRAVIDRLRAAGYNGMADAAKDKWSHGEQVELPCMISPRERELLADYEKAQAQSRPESF